MAYADLNNVRLHYRTDGDPSRPALLLSNSLGARLTMWDEQIEQLRSHLYVVRYDTRGHGQSSCPPGPYTLDQLGGDAMELLDALSIPKASFCGISMGGMTGIWLAVHHTAKLESLALCNTAAQIGPRELWDTRMQAIRTGGLAPMADGVMARWFTQRFRTDNPERVQQIHSDFIENATAGYLACCAAIRDSDMRDEVWRISRPTLVVTGSHDQSTPPALGQFLAENIANASLVELDAAHLSNIEAAQTFTDALMHFLKSTNV